MLKRLPSLLLIFFSALASVTLAETLPDIRLGALPFGTLGWEVATIRNEKLDVRNGFTLVPREVANSQAGKIALQAGAVDVIVSDWIWVARQRAVGSDFTFAPYANNHGALMVKEASDIRSLADLKGKRLGIAGGGLDKNWLLLRGLAQKTLQLDLDSEVEKVFAAPPLLNQQMLQGNLDALLNYWHYAAQLEAVGYRKLLDGADILRGLGIDATVPALGYVFSESWAEKNRGAVEGFLKAAAAAKDRLCDSDTAWEAVLPLTRTDDEELQALLRRRYCEGRVREWGHAEKQAATDVFRLLRTLGGESLTGKAESMPQGIFWTYPAP